MRLGVFKGPWDGGHLAPDGALLAFENMQESVEAEFGGEENSGVRLTGLELGDFLTGALPAQLGALDRVIGECGPLAALLMYWRSQHGLDFTLHRSIHTLGWIGYAFQEFVAGALARPGDSCLHCSHYAASVWGAMRPGHGDRFSYYPHMSAPALPRPNRAPAALDCGFFSRLSRDKGLAWVPDMVAKLLAGGWPIRSLVLCGAIYDEELVRSCAARVQALGVAVRLVGPQPPAEALDVMRGVDVVLFPSLSSFEAAGRVVVEAYQLGKTVIGSDYCAAHDLVTMPYRIPLRSAAPIVGPTETPFLVGELDLESWQAPPWSTPCFVHELCEQFRRDQRLTRAVALGTGALDAAAASVPAAPPASLRMQFDWDALPRRSAEAWCEAVLERLPVECRSRQDLVDLGGAFKRSLIHCGFVPRVCFETSRPA